MKSRSSSSFLHPLAQRGRDARLTLTYYVRESGQHPIARPWISLISLGAFLGMQWLPGIFVLQEVHAQEARLDAVRQVELQKERAIENSRLAQSQEKKDAQRSRIKASQPTDCGVENCQVTPKALDLSKPPTEKQLRMAGGMGGALTPIGPADVPVFADKYDKDLKAVGIPQGLLAPEDTDTVAGRLVKEKKDRLERLKKINLGFGNAMQEWNQHHYRKAAEMLKEHVEEFPDSPWGGEAMLHLGCDAKYNGRFAEASEIYNDLISKTSDEKDSKSFDIHQKAKLRWADLDIAMGKIDDAQAQLQDLVKTDNDWRRRTWAMHWLRMMGLYKQNARTLRACGSEALGFMLVNSGQQKAGAKIALLQPARENGFTLDELQTLAQRHGVQTRGFRGRAADLSKLPTPLLIHYDFDQFGGRLPAQLKPTPDSLELVPAVTQAARQQRKAERDAFHLEHRAGHFLVVRGVDSAKGKVSLFDPQERRGYSMTYAQLDREWSGTGLVRVTKTLPQLPKVAGQRNLRQATNTVAKAPMTRLAWLSKNEMKSVIGGCCGVARTPGDLGPNGPKGPDCGSPTWSINQVNLNMYLSDTPLWYKSPIGPSVNITMNYNSQDATNQSVSFGNKWAFNYGSYVVEDTADGGGQVTVFMPNSRQENFIPNGQGGYTAPLGSPTKLRHPTSTRYELVEPTGEVYVYDIPAGTNSLQPFLLQIRDPWGNALTFGYDAQVHLTTITDALGKVTRLDYDAQGHIIKATDPFGRFASFSYDQWGNMVEVVDLEGNAFQYTYDRDIYITQVNTAQGAWKFFSELPGREFTTPGFNESYFITITDPLNQVTRFGWNGSNVNRDVSFVTGPDKRTTSFHVGVMPDGKGRITSIDYPKDNPADPTQTQTNQIDPSNGQPRVVTDASGASTTFSYNAQGQIDSITDSRGATTRFLFAPNGVDMLGVVDATGKRTGTATFNDKHQMTSFTDIRGDLVSFTYTSWGALKTATYPDTSVTTYNYDETVGSVTRGLLLSVQKGSVTLASYQYDGQGRVLTATGADNKSVSYQYNDLDNATKATLPDGTTSETDYACCGIPSVKTARNGKKTFFDYDALKRLTRVQDAQGNTVQYSYYPVGNLKSITDSNGGVTSWTYDEIGRVKTKSLADGSTERYGYDTANRVLSRMDAKGQIFKSYYDPNGNMVRYDRPGSANDVAISYDTLNRPYQMKDALGITTYGYDNLNRTTLIDGPWANDAITYHYDNMGRRDMMKINGTDQVDYGYDALERMHTVNSIAGQFTFDYVGNTSQLNDTILPSAARTDYSYDSLNRMTQVWNKTGTSALISKYTYGYGDTDGIAGYENTSRRTYRDSQVGAEAIQHVNYSYDDVGQLLGEASTETPTPALNKSYGYDPMGNRSATSSGQGTAQVTTAISTNPLNQATQYAATYANGNPMAVTKFNYDVLGNTVKMATTQGGSPSGTSQYGYTDQDQLENFVSYTSAGVPNHKTSYVYDGLGRKRITREFSWNTTTSAWDTQSEKRYLLDGLDVIQERDETNAVKTVYTRAGNIGGLLAKSKRTTGQADVHLFYHYDGQGNVVQLTNITQAVVADYRYDAFGGSLSATGTEAAGNLFRFSTKELQVASNLYDYGVRFYSPGLGKFINRDPSGEVGGLNLYAAFANNPVSCADEYGLSMVSMAAAFGRGMRDGAFSADGVKALIEGYITAAAAAFLLGSCVPIIPVLTMAVGLVGAAVGIAGLIEAVSSILYSDLCPDEKAYQLGRMVGTMIMGAIGGGLGNKFGPENTKSCFVAGTLVTMADGSQKKIEEVKEGDSVLARDPKTGKDAPHQVKFKKVRHVQETLLLSFSNGTQVETTQEHPFYVAERGFVKAGELGIGNSIVTRAGPSLQVTKSEVKTHGTTVYNLTVAEVNTFFIGADALWVHNYTPEKPSDPEIPEPPKPLFPEKTLSGSGKHGLKWKEAFSRAKADNKPQGKFNRQEDIDFAVEKAGSLGDDPHGVFDLPPDTNATITYPDGTVGPATKVFVKTYPSGKVHAYPLP